MNREEILFQVEKERINLETSINKMLSLIGDIPIASSKIMPFGWRKSAKGRTVWRIIEEIISQNLEVYSQELGFEKVLPAESEVGVYDFKFIYPTIIAIKDGKIIGQTVGFKSKGQILAMIRG